MTHSTTLLVCHHKELIRAGLRGMLERTRITIVGEAADALDVVQLAAKLEPAVVLINAEIPGGDSFEVIQQLRRSSPGSQYVILTAHENPTTMARARAAGAVNCLLKSVTQAELVSAIERAAAGMPAQPESGPFAEVVSRMENTAAMEIGPNTLTRRESQVLSHVAFGLSNAEIARSLEISVETVKEHVQKLLRKMNVRDRTQAAVWAVQQGWA